MQLFVDASPEAITPAAAHDGSKINWISAGQSQTLYRLNNTITITDLNVDPYRKVFRKNWTVGKFLYKTGAYKKGLLNLDVDALRESLYQRYGTYYNKIKLRRAGRNEKREAITRREMDFHEASVAGLVTAWDSARYYYARAKDSLHNAKLLGKLRYYNFNISSTGWINCDRYYKGANWLSELTINLGEGYDASQFVSILIYPRLPALINGNYTYDSRMRFNNLVKNEPAQLICVGVKDDKVVSSITSFTVGRDKPGTPVFEETTPESFRQKLKILMNSPQ
jgi:hypothetical protein